jgi:nucleotide-binding universal stress UspA family protein
MNNSPQYAVVVGVDGSPASLEALRWAVEQARRADAAVTAVMAWTVPQVYDWPMPTAEQLDLSTEDALRKAVHAAVDEDDRPSVQLRVAGGHPAEVLLGASAAADLLVVGHRGLGSFSQALLGSTARYCIDHATCPVVVVRQPSPDPASSPEP